MKRTRKAFSAIMAVLCLCSAVTPLFSSATTYDPCDVNHDGSVNLNDVLTINQHLTGARYYTNYNQLDANQSHTVDATDANCVLQKSIGVTYSSCYIRQYPNAYMEPVSMPAVSSTVTLDSSVNATNGRWYVGYSYLEDAPIERYELTATMDTLGTGQNTQSRGLVNSDDNRGVAHGYENTGIVLINGGVTGFIVGDHHIATVAHNVYYDGGFCGQVPISTYDRTGAPVEGGNLTIAEIHVLEEYTRGYTYANDYALITVEEDLSDYVHFDIGNCYNMTVSEAGTIPIHVTGRPGKTGDNLSIDNLENLLYTHNGHVYEGNDATDTGLLYYTVDTSAGQSGSPAYTITRERYNGEDTYTYTALSIVAGGDTNRASGPLMTKYHQQFYNNNPYASYQ